MNRRRGEVTPIAKARAAVSRHTDASFMSDTKWTEVFRTLEALPDYQNGRLTEFAIKFVDSPVHLVTLPDADSSRWIDSRLGPEPMMLIEWFELRKERVERRGPHVPERIVIQPLDGAIAALERLGQLPLEISEAGVRIVGHRAKVAE